MKKFKYNNSYPFIMLFINEMENKFDYEDINAVFEEYLKREIKISDDILILSTIKDKNSLLYKQNEIHKLNIMFINPEEYDAIDKSKYKYILYLGSYDALILRDLNFKNINKSLVPTTMIYYKKTLDYIDNRLFTIKCMDKNIYPTSHLRFADSEYALADYDNSVFVVYEYPITIIDEKFDEINIIKENLDPLI